MTPPGIDPGTVRLLAQRLNHYDTPDPVIMQLHSDFVQLQFKLFSTHLLQSFNQVSSVLTSKVTHDGTKILDPVIFGRSSLSSPLITHIFQKAEGQDKLS